MALSVRQGRPTDPLDFEIKHEAELIARYIGPHPSKRGREDARIIGFGAPVANVVNYLKFANYNVSETAATYEMPEEAVLAAIAFYRQNRDIIDARILLDTADTQWPRS